LFQFLKARITESPIKTIVFVGILFSLIISLKKDKGFAYIGGIDGDGKGYYLYLPAIFINQNFSHQAIDDRFILDFDGRAANKYYAGTALCMLPFFLIGCIISFVLGIELTGYSAPFQIMIGLAALFYFIAGLVFLSKLLKLFHLNKTSSSFTLIFIAIGSNLFNYVFVEPAMSHVYSWCFISGFLYFVKAFLVENKARDIYWGSVFLGILILIRPINGIVVLSIPFIAQEMFHFRRFFKVRFLFKSASIVLAIVYIQLLLWKFQTGNYFIHSYKNEGFYFSNPELLNCLFSFRKGLFVYSPIILIALLGSLVFWKKNRFAFFAFTSFFLILLYVISSWWNWYYGPSFGQRAFVDFYSVLAIPLAFTIEKIQHANWRKTLLLICSACVFLNLIQTYQYNKQILSSWDMNLQKYAYVFLKTSSKYRNCLGGNNDLPLYNEIRKSIFSLHDDFEENPSNAKVCTWVEQHGNACDYSDRDYNLLFTIPANQSFLSERALFAEIQLDRFELEKYSYNEAFFVIEYQNKFGEIYFNYTLKLNDYPSELFRIWETHKYSVELKRIKSPTDTIRMYVWNQSKARFYLDNVQIELFSIN
jgi:hypothetical protein